MLRFFFLFISVLIFSLGLEAKEFVNSLEDFYLHMKNHVGNVQILADGIMDQIAANPAKWKPIFGIPADVPIDDKLKKIVKGFIEIHDISKLNTDREFLNKINKAKGYINDLYTIYGKSQSNLTPKEKEIIDGINAVDAKERSLYIAKNKLTPWQVNLMDAVEKMSDGVERGMNPVTGEEMAKIPWKESEGVGKRLSASRDPKEIEVLKGKLEMTKKLEAFYDSDTHRYVIYKDRMQKLQEAMRRSGILSEYLDQFAPYQMIGDAEKVLGEKLLPNDPNIVKKFKNYFFNTSQGQARLQRAISPSFKNEANIMMELGKYEVDPVHNAKWKDLSEILEGVCAH
jgi:hypothetical protein